MKRDILSVLDMKEDFEDLIGLSLKLKRSRYEEVSSAKNRVLAMIFEKPSTRTRVSFESAIRQIGGHSLYLNPNDMQLGRGETISDTAKVLSRMVDVIAYRAFEHTKMMELARNATIPVINALDDSEHPVQMLADFMTLYEKFGNLKGLNLTYVGDGNNVANSLLYASALTGVNIRVATPEGYEPKKEYVSKATELASRYGSSVEILNDPLKAAKGADAVYTDVWISMGEENQRQEKEKLFIKYQVNEKLMAQASDRAIFLHCLPAHRNLEVTPGVIDGVRSVVFDEAENRLHTEKALLVRLLSLQ